MSENNCIIYFDGKKLALYPDIEKAQQILQEFEEKNPDDVGRYTVEPIKE